jgi:hypothetical protein
VERDYRLAVRAFIAGFGLGLVVAGGCFAAYLTWGPALRESRAERQLKEMREGAYREALRALEQSEANLQEVQERKQQREELQQGLEEFDKLLNEVRDPEGRPKP